MRSAITFATAAAVLACLAGCRSWTWRDEAPPPPPAAPVRTEAQYLQHATVAKETEAPLPTAIESALLLQDKYSRTLEDLNREQQRNRDLADQNQKVAASAAKLQSELAQAQQELTEANNLLVQMRQELDKWKSDVLGYREETRRAHEAELEALAKVMTLLGAEVPKPASAAAEKPAAPPPEKPVAPAQPKTTAAPAAKTPSAAPAKTAAAPAKAAGASSVVK